MNSKFLELAKKYEELTDQLLAVREELSSAMVDLGVGTFVQDPETKLVYQIQKPVGRFVHFSDLDYIRTKKPEEKSGTLSVKKAQEAGFDV